MLKFIWSIENVSRIYNIVLLFSIGSYAIYTLLKSHYSRKVWFQYFLPGILISLGMVINISINTFSNFKLASQLGFVLPWLILLIIPPIIQRKTINIYLLWKYSYYLMLAIVILGLSDYYLIFILGNSAKVIHTPLGSFLVGKFSILTLLEGGKAHFRFHACFAEPGSLAMMLLPFIAYAFLYKKYIGMFILLVGFYLSYSLGGLIGLWILSILLIYYKTRYKTNSVLAIVLVTTTVGIGYTVLNDNFKEQYTQKGVSAMTREESFSSSMKNLPTAILNNPLGLSLHERTSEANKDNLYSGSNFIPAVYFQTGGLIAFIGYIIMIIVSLKTAIIIFFSKNKFEIEYIVIASSIILMVPFLFQRTTILESPLFALLYATAVLDIIENYSISHGL